MARVALPLGTLPAPTLLAAPQLLATQLCGKALRPVNRHLQNNPSEICQLSPGSPGAWIFPIFVFVISIFVPGDSARESTVTAKVGGFRLSRDFTPFEQIPFAVRARPPRVYVVDFIPHILVDCEGVLGLEQSKATRRNQMNPQHLRPG